MRRVPLDVEEVAATVCAAAAQRAFDAQSDAEAVLARAIGLVTYATRGEGREPTDEELAAFARATGANASAEDSASRVLRAARARLRIARGYPVATAEVASAVGVSRQYAQRAWGTLLRCDRAREIVAEYDARRA